MLFILFSILSIRRASKKYELNSTKHAWAIAITSLALVIAASYAGAWLTGVAISVAAQYIAIFQELLRLLNDPTIGIILSTLVAAPTTILAVMVVPKWTFHLAAHGKLKSDNNQPSQSANPRPASLLPQPTAITEQDQDNSPRRRLRTDRRSGRYSSD